MRLALFMLLVATAMTSVSASMAAPTLTEPAPQTLTSASSPAILKPQDKPQQINDSTAPLAHKTSLQKTVALAPQAAQASPEQEHKTASGWQDFAPVAVTLALIAAIAVRRHQAGKP